MVGSVGNGLVDLGAAAAIAVNGNGKALHPEAAAAAAEVEALPMEVDPEMVQWKREIVLGRSVHMACFAMKEPDADNEETGEREATMASILALYRRSLVERTKHHLGM